MQGTRFDPWSRKIPRATEQLSSWATTTDACAPRAQEPQQEKPWREKAERGRSRAVPAGRSWRKPVHSSEDPAQLRTQRPLRSPQEMPIHSEPHGSGERRGKSVCVHLCVSVHRCACMCVYMYGLWARNSVEKTKNLVSKMKGCGNSHFLA